MDIQVYDRRGAANPMAMDAQGIDILDDNAYGQHLARQDRRRRSWEGIGEFEPAFFNTLDDAESLREMAQDPYLFFQTGVTTTKKGYELSAAEFKADTFGLWARLKPARKNKAGGYDEEVVRINFFTPVCFNDNGECDTWNSWVKVVPLMHCDWEHVEVFKMPRFGDNSVNLTHGEQEEVRRMSMGSRLKEEELAMDFRSPSKFLLDPIMFTTVDFELPNMPQHIQEWLNDTAWPTHTKVRDRLIEHLSAIMAWKVPNQDNRKKAVKAARRVEQAKRVNRLWGKFWHWWVTKVEATKESGLKPMTNRQLASIKGVFEMFRATMNLDQPVMRFWARVHCMKCNVQSNQLLPLSYTPQYAEGTDEIICLDESVDHEGVLCKTCGTKSGMVLWFESHTIIHEDSHGAPDWFDVAQDLKEKIASLYKIAADLEEIRPLESWLHHIETLHIKLDADQLLWGEYDAIDARFC